MTNNVKQAVPFLWVHDIERSIAFYQTLGFQLINQWVNEGKLTWCWLQIGGAAIMLQEFSKKDHHEDMSVQKLGDGISICFICEDALEIYNEISSKDIDASEPFVGNNMWVTELKDPDDYDLCFESKTDAPEETKLSEWKNSPNASLK